MLVAGIRGDHDWTIPSGSIKPEGFIRLDSEIGRNVRAVAEIAADTERIAGMAGIKITW
jgi:hypothetical protein